MDKEKILNRFKERVGKLFKVTDCYDRVVNTMMFNDISKECILDILSKMHAILDSSM